MGYRQERKFQRLVEWINKGWVEYEEKPKKKRNWSKYERAQVKEVTNTLKLIRRMVNEAWAKIDKPEKGKGRPPKSPADKAKAILLKESMQCSDRVAVDYVNLFREKLGIKEDIKRKDIERGYDDPMVEKIFSEMFKMSNEPIKDEEENFSIDGTGDSTSITNHWSEDREEKDKKSLYEKIITVSGYKYKLFAAAEIADGKANESPFLKPLLEQTMQIFSYLNIFSADAAYLSRANCTTIENFGGTPRIYPKKNSTLKQRGSKAWWRMFKSLLENHQKWLEEFHMRSISESCYSVYKRKFTTPLKRDKKSRRKTQAMSRVLAYNIRQLNYIHFLHDEINVRWLKN